MTSFADSKLLDFSRASDSVTLRIMGIAHYIRYVRIINAQRIRIRYSCKIVRAFDDHGMTVASFQL